MCKATLTIKGGEVSFKWHEDENPTEQEIELAKLFAVAMRGVASFIQNLPGDRVVIECDEINGIVNKALDERFKK